MTENRETQYKMLALNIAYYRKLKGLSQIQLAEKAGISRTYLSSIEAPGMIAIPSLDTLLDIAKALDVEPGQLLDFKR